MIIAIDGPTASGKSTLARMLAEELGMYYVSSGLLYRALAYILMHSYNYQLQDLAAPDLNHVLSCLDKNDFAYSYTQQEGAALFFKGKNITPFLKTKDIDQGASIIAAHQEVRHALLQFQRAFAQKNSVVMEGRDIGSVIFPDADYKFFITASVDVRAQRWQRDQNSNGKNFTLEQSINSINERDTRDKEREHSPLTVAPGSIIIDTSNLSRQQALQKMLSYIKKT